MHVIDPPTAPAIAVIRIAGHCFAAIRCPHSDIVAYAPLRLEPMIVTCACDAEFEVDVDRVLAMGCA